MGYYRTYLHIVFATKHRQRMLTPELEEVIFPIVREAFREAGAHYFLMNGGEDHVHMLVGIHLDRPWQEALRQSKLRSGRAARKLRPGFMWQRSFAAFSVDYGSHKGLIRYLRNQKTHHDSRYEDRYLEWVKHV